MTRPKPAPPARLPAWLFGTFLVLTTVLAYQPVWHAGFIWDDDAFLTANPLIKAADGLYRFWFTTAAPDYFPLTSTTLWLEWRLWENHPLGYHLVNVLLHAASAVLLWRVLARLKIPGAWLAAAIFALHPVNVESVAWITERKNTLAMFFGAGTLLLYLKFEDARQRRWYWLALAAFALALLSKTAVAPLPLVLLALGWWRRGRVERRDIGRVLPFFAMAALLGLVTVWFQYHQAIGSDVVRADSFWARLAGAGWAIWFYLYKAFCPLDLAFVYPRWSIDPSRPLSYLPGLLVVALLAVCWRYRWRWGKAALFALGAFIVMLLPVLGFLNIYFMRYSLVADHWQYFAIVGPIALAAAALTTLDQHWSAWPVRPGTVLAGAVLLAFGLLTWKQARLYESPETLWRATLASNPGCWLAHDNLGILLDAKGQPDEAIREYREALRLKPDYPSAHNNLGVALAAKGQMEEAIAHYAEAIRRAPDYAETYNNLAAAHLKQGHPKQAVGEFRQALRLKPNYAQAHYLLANALAGQGQLDEAMDHYQQAIRCDPNLVEAYLDLGAALDQRGRPDAAADLFRQAIHLRPEHATAHYNLANVLAKQGHAGEAIGQYQETLRLKPNHVDAHNNLGVALYQQGRFPEAITHFREALRLKPDYADVRRNLDAALAAATNAPPESRPLSPP